MHECTLGISHILPRLLNLVLAKVIFQSQQKKLYFCHSWYSIYEITSVHNKEALFHSSKLPLLNMVYYSWILCRDGRAVIHLNLRHALLLGPQSNTTCAQHLKKFLTKAISVFLSLFSYCKQISNNSTMQKRMLPTKKQTNAGSTKQTILVA